MKTIKQTLLIGLLTVLLSPVGFAQNFDTNRMNRDIKIMENILDELFKVRMMKSSSRQDVFFSTGSFSSGNVKGTYLPGYGVIFMISNNRFPGGINVVSRDGDDGYSFYYSSDDKEGDLEVDEESVISRTSEFMKDYASTIGQLDEDDHVLLIYGSKNTLNNHLRIYSIAGKDLSDDEEMKKLPVISVSAKKGDLDAYRSGRVNEKSFTERLKISKSEEKEYLDLKVMNNIFETALREAPEESFRLSGHASYLMLDNFGALFSLNVRYSNYASVSGSASVLFRDIKGAVSINSNKDRSRNVQSLEEAKEKKLEQQKKISEAYNKLKTELKEYIVDYGRTLSSLKSDQFILTSVTISDSWSDKNVPERIDIQVKKSVLEQLDRGSISRQEALNNVTVTEY